MPQEIGDAQKELGIQKEATYIITVINPNKPVPEGYLRLRLNVQDTLKILKNILTTVKKDSFHYHKI